MATILNIETSSKICSVAISKDGVVDYQLEDTEGMQHAVRLAPFIEKCLAHLERKGEKLDAVAVSLGPGSYTGLRIGLSAAKGLAFGLGLPLIGVPTLEILAVKAMFRNIVWEGDEILIPMVDARRIEVYTCAYDFALNELIQPGALILDKDSYMELRKTGRNVVLLGDGSAKAAQVIEGENIMYLDGVEAHARDMVALSEKFLRDGRLLDVAYSTPLYLKNYIATVPKNKISGCRR